MENFSIHHIDSMFGPSRLARYEGGGCETSCNVSTKIWIDLHDDIEQEVRKSGTYETEEEIQKNTSIRFMSLYVKDVQTIREEWSGKEVIPGDDLLVTDRGVMTQVGDEYVPAEHQFITKRQEKGLEDRGESRTLRAAIGAMVASPEAEAYFPVHNQGSDGTDQIRHVAHWKRVGNRIKTEMINISGNQQDKTLLEAQRTLEYAIGKNFVHHQDSTRSYIFTRGVQREGIHFSEINHQQKRTSLNLSFDRAGDSRATPEFLRETHQGNTLDRALFDAMIHVGNKVAYDTKDTVTALGAFVLHKASERRRKQGIKSQTPDRQVERTMTEHIRELFSKSAEDRSHENQQTRLTIEKIREKPVRMVEVIEKRYREMRKEVVAIKVIAETGAAVHALPAILASLAEKHPAPVRAVEKSIRRHKLRKAKREAKKDSVKVQPFQPLRSERVELFRAAKERKRKKVRTEVNRERKRVKRSKENGIKKIAAASEKIPSALKKRESQEKRRLRQVVEKSLRRHKKKELRRSEKRETKKDSSIQRKEREAVAGMVFGWMVWVMLNRANFPPVESKIAKLVQERRGAKLVHLPGGLEGGDREPTPWVLLSIIWYLTAIREQGMQSNPTNPTNTTNNQMKKRNMVIPQYAVIFAYNS